MTRIFIPIPLASHTTVELPDTAAHHVVKVLRMQPGDAITLFNGDGNNYSAHLCDVSKRSARAIIDSQQAHPTASPLNIHLGQVISKGDRMDFTLQKATELGVSQITPLFSVRGDVRLNPERLEKKIRHWQQVIISACEQSGRTDLPTLNAPMQALAWAEQQDADRCLVMHPSTQRLQDDQSCAHSPNRVALLVGPEGGFEHEEVDAVMSMGFDGMRLGPRVLRTETAALTAISILQYQWGDF